MTKWFAFYATLEKKYICIFFFGICPPPGLLHVMGPCERYMTPTLDAALLMISRVGTDPGLLSDSGVLMLLQVETV